MASDALVRSKHDAQAVDRVGHVVGHVVGQVEVVADRGEQGGLFAPAKRKVIGLIVHAERLVGAHKRIVRVERRMVKPKRACLGVWLSMSDEAVFEAPFDASLDCSAATMLTEPFGPTTSFTKNATSLIIGPQPASYQPTEPSSKATWRTP